MDPISGVGAAFGIVEACFNTWKSATEQLQERVIIVEGVWIRTKRQIEFMQRVAPKIDDELSNSLDGLLHQLYRCLSNAASRIESVQQKESSYRGGFFSRSSRARSAWVMKKDAIDEATKELENWQRRFDPSWFFILTIADPLVDQELQNGRSRDRERRGPPDAARSPLAVAAGIRGALESEGHHRSMFLPETPMEVMDIRYCEAQMCRLLSTSGDKKWYITNTIRRRPGLLSKVLAQDTNSLATKLAQADPIAFGLLNCKGVAPITVKQSGSTMLHVRDQLEAVRMIFRMPEGMETLQSLRDVLLVFPKGISQTRRIRIACSLAGSISYLHTFRFIHKNVRPESILCFEREHQDFTFLVGFDAFRAADGSTNLLGDHEWDRNIYRHPQRQGVHVAEKYRMEHDMYSLGICLLEIGLWDSLVEYTAEEPVPGKWFAGMEAWLGGYVPGSHEIPWKVKEFLTDLARESLPVRMGEKYTAAVLACLTCLDTDSDRGLVEGELKTAVHFVEEILFLLQDITT